MNSLPEFTDEEVLYLYDLTCRVMQRDGEDSHVDESTFQKVASVARGLKPKGRFDMSDFELDAHGFIKVYGLPKTS